MVLWSDRAKDEIGECERERMREREKCTESSKGREWTENRRCWIVGMKRMVRGSKLNVNR